MKSGAILLAFLGGCALAVAAQSPRRVYIEERIKSVAGTNVHCDNFGNCYGRNASTERNISLEVTRELTKTCGNVVVTDNREAADFVLRIAPGASTLYDRNGDVAYISPAKFRVTNLAKDVCQYVASHKAATPDARPPDLTVPPPPGAVARCADGTFALVDTGENTSARSGGVVERFKKEL